MLGNSIMRKFKNDGTVEAAEAVARQLGHNLKILHGMSRVATLDATLATAGDST